MKMKKLLFTCAAVAGVSLALGATAFADVAIGKVTETTNTTTASVATLPARTGQVTVIVVKLAAPADGAESIATPTSISDDDIIYIDQDAYKAGMFKNMGLKEILADGSKALKPGDYYMVRVGSEKIEDGIYEEVYKVVSENTTPDYILGDADGNKNVDGLDATKIMDYTVELTTLTGNNFLAADVNKNGNVDGIDATDILDYTVDLPSYVAGTKTPAE